MNARFALDDRPIEEGCQCPTCQRYSRSYVHHLLKRGEMLGMRFSVLHNLYFYNKMLQEIREAIEKHEYQAYKKEKLAKVFESEWNARKKDIKQISIKAMEERWDR